MTFIKLLNRKRDFVSVKMSVYNALKNDGREDDAFLFLDMAAKCRDYGLLLVIVRQFCTIDPKSFPEFVGSRRVPGPHVKTVGAEYDQTNDD